MKLFRRISVAILICVMAAFAAVAGVKSSQVTFNEDTTVSGETVKKGTYKVSYNEETGELTVFAGKREIKATARLEKRQSKARDNQISTVLKDNARALRSITFAGQDQAMVLGDGDVKAEPNKQQ